MSAHESITGPKRAKAGSDKLPLRWGELRGQYHPERTLRSYAGGRPFAALKVGRGKTVVGRLGTVCRA